MKVCSSHRRERYFCVVNLEKHGQCQFVGMRNKQVDKYTHKSQETCNGWICVISVGAYIIHSPCSFHVLTEVAAHARNSHLKAKT
jgi:hypothetical protein